MVKNVDNFDANSISKKSSIGLIELDFEYPDELYQLHNYLLVPEKLPILMTCCQIIVKKLLTTMK